MAKLAKPAAKKTASVKPAPKKAERTIKYEDKSAGQPDLVVIFNQLRNMLLPFVKGSIRVQEDTAGQLHLYSNKPIEVNGRKRDAVYFASILVQKGYVGFYFMPAYTDVFLKKLIAPGLLKLLKGKACFHIKKLDEGLKEQLQKALELGYECYRDKGWA